LLANQDDYLDQLYKVYPMPNNLNRTITDDVKIQLDNYMNNKNNKELIELLLKQEVFPLKDSYVAYLKRDKASIGRNPQTINRLAGMVCDLGYGEVLKLITRPIETNRQIGPMFKQWLEKNVLGIDVCTDEKEFMSTNENLVFIGSDAKMKQVAADNFGYTHDKGLDFICRMNGKIVLGETKFLTDFGGHQNAQFADAMSVISSKFKPTKYEVIPVAILDGVLYIKSENKLYNAIKKDVNVFSALFLRDYLYSL